MRRLIFAGVLVLCLLAIGLVSASSGQTDAPAWAAPAFKAIKRVSGLGQYQNQPVLFSNMDCNPTGYRMSGSSTMQVGCFTQTAFGEINSDNDTVIYNGSDEAVPLLPHLGNDILAPWQQAGVLLDLDPATTGGSYISLYLDPLAGVRTIRNSLGQVVGKQLTSAPNLTLLDPAGKPLVINPQTLAFSEEGGWLVAEDLNGSFVRLNLASLDVLAFAPAYGTSGSPGLLKSQVAVSRDGRYVVINNEAAGAFKVYDLTTCGLQKSTSLVPLTCQSYDYRYFIGQQIAGLQYIDHVRFVNDGVLSFEAHTANSTADGVYEMAPTDKISSLIEYLGLGDSYTSGEGAFDYLNGTDTADDNCHLSVNSYPLLLTRDMFGSQAGHSVACSGAEIHDVNDLSASYRGQVRGVPSWQELQSGDQSLLNSVMAGFLPGYVAQERFVKQYQPAVATVSVGGNDIGFGNIMIDCVEPKISIRASKQDCFSTYEDRLEVKNLIDRTVPKWTRLYQGLLAAAPGVRLYAIGYPQIVSDTGSCGLNVHLSQVELEFTEEITDYLDGSIKQAAGKAGINYIDISQALKGHRLCEAAASSIAVNGLTAGDDKGALGINFLGKESYHPNALGQQLIEQALLRQTNFSAAAVPVDVSPVGDQLLNRPSTGRTIYNLAPSSSITSPTTAAGQTIQISLSGSQNGLQPGSPYSVHLDGPTGQVIGSGTADSSGNVSGTGTVPAGTEPGGHTVDVIGSNQTGEPVDAGQPIYVTGGGGDSDGDGLTDKEDSCPHAVNSGIDQDNDGIDDACDPSIGQSESDPGSGNPPQNNSDSGGSTASSDGAETSGDYLINKPLQAASFSLGTASKAQRLGYTTAAPSIVTATNLRPANAKQLPPLTSFPFTKLRTFNWLRWVMLPVLAWWLVVLWYLFGRFVK